MVEEEKKVMVVDDSANVASTLTKVLDKINAGKEETETWPKAVVADLPEASKQKIKRMSEAKKAAVLGMTERKWSFDRARGEIKTYEKEEDFNDDLKNNAWLVPMDRLPKKNCKACMGRGYIGKDIRHNAYIPCGCIFGKGK